MEVWRREAPRLEKCVGVGAARAARAAGFEVGGKHPAEQARFASTFLPMGRARGNSGPPTFDYIVPEQCLQAFVKHFQDALVNGKYCSFGVELAAKRQFSCHNRSAKRLRND